MQVLLQPVGPGDQSFLADLYADTRREELSITGWPQHQIDAFLQMQFEAQRADYTRRFPASDHDPIVAGGGPVGRIWVNRGAGEILLIDLALLTTARNRGLGTTLIRSLQHEAGETSRRLRHSVVKENSAALRLYTRLDFVIVGDAATHHLMEWRAPLGQPGGSPPKTAS